MLVIEIVVQVALEIHVKNKKLILKNKDEYASSFCVFFKMLMSGATDHFHITDNRNKKIAKTIK